MDIAAKNQRNKAARVALSSIHNAGIDRIGFARSGANGHLISADPQFVRLCGRSEEQLLGASVTDLIKPIDKGRTQAGIRELWSGSSSHLSFQTRCILLDGSSIPVQLTISIAWSSAGEQRQLNISMEDLSPTHEVFAYSPPNVTKRANPEPALMEMAH